jgi:hypothetical protein
LRTSRILPSSLFPGLASSPLYIRPFRFALEPHTDQHALMRSFFWAFIFSDQKGGRKVTDETNRYSMDGVCDAGLRERHPTETR